MSDKIDNESVHPEITKKHVEERVQDWLSRLNSLFREVRTWGEGNDWKIKDSDTISMNEELMQKFEVQPVQQPTLRLEKNNSYALLRPKGLWVIGANGRVDLFTQKGTFVVVDLANQGEDSQWMIFRSSDKREGECFTPDIISGLV